MPLISNIKSMPYQEKKKAGPRLGENTCKRHSDKGCYPKQTRRWRNEQLSYKGGPKTWTDRAHRRRQRWQTSAGKMLHTQRLSSGKRKFKQQWDTPPRLLERSRPRAPTAPNVDNNVEQQEPSFTAGGNADWYGHFGGQFGGFLQN